MCTSIANEPHRIVTAFELNPTISRSNYGGQEQWGN